MTIAPRNARRPSSIDIWPGFVDALSQLLMIIIFILLVFTAGQFYLSAALSGRDVALHKLEREIDKLAQELALEQSTDVELGQKATLLSARLKSAETERGRLSAQIAGLEGDLAAERQKLAAAQKEIAAREQRLQQLSGRTEQSQSALAAQKEISSSALTKIDTLNAQIAALREQLTRIAAALDISEAKVKAQQGQIADLGQKLNLALVKKVEELGRYRSEFYGRLREILGNRPGIRIEGDRFVFQSEVLFAPGSAELSADAKKELDPVIAALKEIAAQIPADIDWTLRVDGHTDHNPIHTAQFPSNWELSNARALSVLRYAMAQGIPDNRLVAAGFADTRPLDPGETPEALSRNRRIELRLTER
jgi:chemotaxis protein MotB